MNKDTQNLVRSVGISKQARKLLNSSGLVRKILFVDYLKEGTRPVYDVEFAVACVGRDQSLRLHDQAGGKRGEPLVLDTMEICSEEHIKEYSEEKESDNSYLDKILEEEMKMFLCLLSYKRIEDRFLNVPHWNLNHGALKTLWRRFEIKGETVRMLLLNPIHKDRLVKDVTDYKFSLTQGCGKLWTASVYFHELVPMNFIYGFPEPEKAGCLAVRQDLDCLPCSIVPSLTTIFTEVVGKGFYNFLESTSENLLRELSLVWHHYQESLGHPETNFDNFMLYEEIGMFICPTKIGRIELI